MNTGRVREIERTYEVGREFAIPPWVWREIELELVGHADPAILETTGQILSDAGARPAAATSKLGRVLAGRLPRPRTEAGKVGCGRLLNGSSSAGAVIRAYLQTHVDALIAADPLVRLDEPDAVHKMRVASRRIRSTLRTFAPLFDKVASADLDRRLSQLAGALSGSRDQEVMRERLANQLASLPDDLVIGPVEATIKRRLEADLARSREQVLRTLHDEEYLRLVADLQALVAGPYECLAARPAFQELPKLAYKAGRKFARRVAQLDNIPPGPERDAHYHQTRKQAQRLLYAADALIPLLGDEAVQVGRFAERAQEILGDHQDAIVIGDRLRRWADEECAQAGESAFTFGVLLGMEIGRARVNERDFACLWAETYRPVYRRWMLAARRPRHAKPNRPPAIPCPR